MKAAPAALAIRGLLLWLAFAPALSSADADTAAGSVAEGRPGPAASDAGSFGRPPPYRGKLASLSLVNIRDAKLERVLARIERPWAFEFLSEQEILLTQMSGRLLRIDLQTGASREITGLPAIGLGPKQAGLLDVALHPQFADNGKVYLSFSRAHPSAPGYFVTELAVGTLGADRLSDVRLLLDSPHFGWAPSNFGGAIEFDDRDFLYVSIGDRAEDALSRRGDRLEGKILRLNGDGSTPGDNPFAGDDHVDPRIFALGVRNAQGLHFDAESRALYASDHGPLGGDEVNRIEAGRDYGWPTISYGAHYSSTEPIGVGTHQAGLEQPLFYFLPSIAVSPITVYRGSMFPEWNGDLLVGALRGKQLVRLDLDAGIIRSSQPVLQEIKDRVRDIKVASDGSVYILGETRGLYRLYREPRPAGGGAGQDGTGTDLAQLRYELVCAGCHDTGASGAPVLGELAQWQKIIEQPAAVTRERTINGHGEMPERGFCYTCTDDQLMAIVDFMFQRALAASDD